MKGGPRPFLHQALQLLQDCFLHCILLCVSLSGS